MMVVMVGFCTYRKNPSVWTHCLGDKILHLVGSVYLSLLLSRSHVRRKRTVLGVKRLMFRIFEAQEAFFCGGS